MHKTNTEAIDFVQKLSSFLETHSFHECNVVIAPPSIHLPLLCQKNTQFSLAAQNIAFEKFGAYTGEISAPMLHEYVGYVLVGHSERRQYFNETDQNLLKKLILSFQYNLQPIFCFGETQTDRESGNYLSIIQQQLEKTIMQLPEHDMLNLILAYEPIWAIGTGANALPNQIEEVHSCVHELIAQKFNINIADEVSVLYGGSCNIDNAKSILCQKHVNGLLIGGASLDFDHLCKIIQVANQ